MNILLADDDPKIHRIVQLWLCRNGHDVDNVGNGREALAKFDERGYDVLISDINMPLLNGIDLIKEVLNRDDAPGLIVVMTSRCDISALTEAMGSKRVSILNKPFSPKELSGIIEDFAGKDGVQV